MRTGIAILVVLALSMATANAATLFLSDKDLGQTPVLGNPSITMNVGDTKTLYVWGSLATSEVINGLGLSVVAEAAGIVHATSSTLLNPTTDDFGNRWDSVNNGTLGSLVMNMNGPAVNGHGLGGSALQRGEEAPTGYDTPTGYLKVAEIVVHADAPGVASLWLQSGTATISFKSGKGGPNINFGTGDASVDPRTAGVRSAVADGTITVLPEPATLSLLGLGALSLIRRRR